jgi:hypothetical protein
MALMGRRPEICRIGESTQGVFSDVLDRRLPNGWRLVLPNEIYITAGGNSFDVSGVPPDVGSQVFLERISSNSAIRRWRPRWRSWHRTEASSGWITGYSDNIGSGFWIGRLFQRDSIQSAPGKRMRLSMAWKRGSVRKPS